VTIGLETLERDIFETLNHDYLEESVVLRQSLPVCESTPVGTAQPSYCKLTIWIHVWSFVAFDNG